MTRVTCTAFLLLVVLAAVGCGSYDVTTSHRDTPADSAGEQGAGPTVDSPPAPSPPTAPPSGSLAGGDASDATRTKPAGEAGRPAPPSPSPPGPPPSTPARSTPPSPPPSPSVAARQPSIRLSTAVALPQTLPSGTAVGFSIDYQFTQGRPNPSSTYAWVIERSKGQPVKQQVRLQSQGTLQGFVLEFRPEHGPFQTHIEDDRGNRLSPSVPFR